MFTIREVNAFEKVRFFPAKGWNLGGNLGHGASKHALFRQSSRGLLPFLHVCFGPVFPFSSNYRLCHSCAAEMGFKPRIHLFEMQVASNGKPEGKALEACRINVWSLSAILASSCCCFFWGGGINFQRVLLFCHRLGMLWKLCLLMEMLGGWFKGKPQENRASFQGKAYAS